MIKKNRFRLFSALAIALLLLIVAVAFFLLRPEFHRQTEDAEAEDYELQGVDLSAHNGNVDFSRMKEAGIDFVILKASEGNGFRDSRFEENYEKAVAGGLDVGAYHFFRFDVDGVEQAKNFMSTVAGKRFDLPLAIDVEEHGNPYVFVKSKVVRHLQNMIDELTANEYRIMIYTNKGGYEKFIRNIGPHMRPATELCRIYGAFYRKKVSIQLYGIRFAANAVFQPEGCFVNWELTKAGKSFIVKELWDTKFDRGSMQIFLTTLWVKAIRTAGSTAASSKGCIID